MALILSLTALAAATLVFLPAAPAAQARAFYSCGNASSGHCYAIAQTSVPFDSDGATTRIYMVYLTCSQCGQGNTTPGFIDNEMWFNDNTGPYWVEVGYIGEANSSQFYQDYFWGDHRPVDCGGCVNFHDEGGVPSGDYGQNPKFVIYYGGNNEYSVTIESPTTGWHTYYSTNNSMVPNDVKMGQELAGNAGASASDARFSYRYYWDETGSYIAIDYSYGTTYDHPPYLGYVPNDSDFYTYCC